MKRMIYVAVLLIGLPFLGGCGKQGFSEIPDLAQFEQGYESKQTLEDVTVIVKKLSPKDCAKLFGKRNLSFSPVLVSIENRSQEAYLFEVKKQGMQLIDVKYKNIELSGAADLKTFFIVFGGSGLALVSWFGVIFGTMAYNAPEFFVSTALAGLFGGIGLAVYGLFFRSQSKEYRMKPQVKLLKKTSYFIEKRSNEFLLLFFEKNMVPDTLNIIFQSQSDSGRSLIFELKRNNASRSNEFIYKTV